MAAMCRYRRTERTVVAVLAQLQEWLPTRTACPLAAYSTTPALLQSSLRMAASSTGLTLVITTHRVTCCAIAPPVHSSALTFLVGMTLRQSMVMVGPTL